MDKQVTLTFLRDGDFEQGFNTILAIEDDAGNKFERAEGKLPPGPDIGNLLTNWRDEFNSIVTRQSASRGKPGKVVRISGESAKMIAKALNLWLASDHEEWKRIRDILNQTLGKDEEIRLIIETENFTLRQLPWQVWKLVSEDFGKMEIALSFADAKNPVQSPSKRSTIRILAVFGQNSNLDTDFDKNILESLQEKNARVKFLHQPAKAELSAYLWDDRDGWDIFFFAGHSGTSKDGKIGWIGLNDDEQMEIGELRNGIKTAISRGLQLAIFNSCDGLGLAHQLARLNLPQSIVMREPVPDEVAKKFLEYFLGSFSGGESFYYSVRRARERIEDEFDAKYPGIGWLITICQNTLTAPPKWGKAGLVKETLWKSESGKLLFNPYKGLEAFQENDADRFFGREKVISEIWEKFDKLCKTAHQDNPARRILTVQGPSGSGKSSVVRAGLVPKLKSEGRCVKIFSPEHENPLRKLAVIMAQIITNEQAPVKKSDEFESIMVQTNDGLGRVAEFLPENSRHVVLVIDQFEELFTRCPDKKIQKAFVENLLISVSDRSGRISAVITLRSDFLRYAQNFPGLISDAASYLLVAMNDKEIEEAIVRPAEIACNPSDKQPFSPEFVRLMISDTRQNEGALPLLQFALEQVWEKLADEKNKQVPGEILDSIGGVGGALAKKGGEIYDDLVKTDKNIARRCFLRLVDINRDVSVIRRRKVLISELTSDSEKTEQVHSVLNKFSEVNARLITFGLIENTQKSITAEITHETLIEEWKELRKWVKEDRQRLLDYRLIREAAKQWDAEGRPTDLLWHPKRFKNTKILFSKKSNTGNADINIKPNSLEKIFFDKSRRKRRNSFIKKYVFIPIGFVMAIAVLSLWGVLFSHSTLYYREVNFNNLPLPRGSGELSHKRLPTSYFEFSRKGNTRLESIKYIEKNHVVWSSKFFYYYGKIEYEKAKWPCKILNTLSSASYSLPLPLPNICSQPTIERIYCDSSGKPANDQYGISKNISKYNDKLELSEHSFFDKNNNAASNSEGISKWIYSRYENGSLVKTEYFDENDRPAYTKDGYSKKTQRYDGKTGRIKEVAYFDGNNRPTAYKADDFYHKIVYNYDNNSENIVYTFYDCNEELIKSWIEVQVSPMSPEQSIGFISGDIILAVDNIEVHSQAELNRILENSETTERKLTILRKGELVTLNVPAKIRFINIKREELSTRIISEYTRQGKYDIAANSLRYIKPHPVFFTESVAAIVNFYQGELEYQKCIELLEYAIQKAPDEPYFLLAKGNLQSQIGNKDAAIYSYRQTVKISKELLVNDSSNIEVQNVLIGSLEGVGEIFLYRGDIDATLQEYEQAIKIAKKIANANPSDIEAQRTLSGINDRLGTVYLRVNNTDIAFEYYNQAIKITQKLADNFPENINIQRDLSVLYNNSGDAHLQSGDTDNAFQLYQKAMNIAQNNLNNNPLNKQFQEDLLVGFDRIGMVYLTKKDYENALTEYEKANKVAVNLCETDPQNIHTRWQLVNIYEKIADIEQNVGRVYKALDAYEKLFSELNELVQMTSEVSTILEKFVFACNMLDHILLDMKDKDSVIQIYQKIAELNKKIAELDKKIAKSEPEQCEKALRRILEINPKHVNALNFLGYTLAERAGRYQEAYDLLKKAVGLEPENPFVLDSYGWVLYKMGNYEESLENLRKAYAKTDALTPEAAAEIAAHLGEVLWSNGNKDEAKGVFEKALRGFPENEKLKKAAGRFIP